MRKGQYRAPNAADSAQYGAPARAQQSGSRGERRGSGVSELSCTHGSEGYAACPDEVSRETSSEESTLHSVRHDLPDIHSVSFFLLPPQGPLRLCPCGDPEIHCKKTIRYHQYKRKVEQPCWTLSLSGRTPRP